MPKGIGYGFRRRAPRLTAKRAPSLRMKGTKHRTILSPGGNISRSAPSGFRIRPQNAV